MPWCAESASASALNETKHGPMVQAPKESWDQQMIDDCMRLARLQREGFSEHNKAIEMATQAAIDKFVNQVGSSFDGMCAKVTNQIQGNLQRMETYVDNANNEHKERKQKESRSSLGKCQSQFSANSTFTAKHYKLPTANKN